MQVGQLGEKVMNYMNKHSMAMGIEINPKLVGALFTDKIGDTLRLFCFYTNGETSQFDVPHEDNRDNLRGLLASLNAEETCTSLILDEVVQGRVYVQANNQHWLYTLLRSPGNIPPPLNADIADLPWQVCWRSHEAEVLRYQQPNDPERCLAIRTRIGENDAARLVKTSKAFTHPVSIPSKRPQPRPYLNLAVALLALVVLVGATLFYTFRQSHRAAAAPVAAVQTKALPAMPGYYLLCNHRISGPYPAKVIADMTAGGLFSDGTMCRPENSMEWGKLAAVFPPVARN